MCCLTLWTIVTSVGEVTSGLDVHCVGPEHRSMWGWLGVIYGCFFLCFGLCFFASPGQEGPGGLGGKSSSDTHIWSHTIV